MSPHPCPRAPRWALAAGLLALTGACASEDAPARTAPPRATDKHALYGDAVLVPTREGERVRKEIALAGQIEAAVRVATGTPHVVADVELEGTPPRVAVAVRLSAPAVDPDAARHSVRSLAGAIVKDADVFVLLVAAGSATPTDPSPARPSAWLLLAILGLGTSLGIAIERLRLRGLRRPRR